MPAETYKSITSAKLVSYMAIHSLKLLGHPYKKWMMQQSRITFLERSSIGCSGWDIGTLTVAGHEI